MFYTLQPLEWKRYIDDIFWLWSVDKKEIEEFIVLVANSDQRTIKFTAEISDKEINFLDTTVFKGETFNKQAILDICKLSSTLTSLPATQPGVNNNNNNNNNIYPGCPHHQGVFQWGPANTKEIKITKIC